MSDTQKPDDYNRIIGGPGSRAELKWPSPPAAQEGECTCRRNDPGFALMHADLQLNADYDCPVHGRTPAPAPDAGREWPENRRINEAIAPAARMFKQAEYTEFMAVMRLMSDAYHAQDAELTALRAEVERLQEGNYGLLSLMGALQGRVDALRAENLKLQGEAHSVQHDVAEAYRDGLAAAEESLTPELVALRAEVEQTKQGSRFFHAENVSLVAEADALRADREAAQETIRRQRVWAQVGMNGLAEDDKANADKLVEIDALVTKLEADREALEARATLADEKAKPVFIAWREKSYDVVEVYMACPHCYREEVLGEGAYAFPENRAEAIANFVHTDNCWLARYASLPQPAQEQGVGE